MYSFLLPGLSIYFFISGFLVAGGGDGLRTSEPVGEVVGDCPWVREAGKA